MIICLSSSSTSNGLRLSKATPRATRLRRKSPWSGKEEEQAKSVARELQYGSIQRLASLLLLVTIDGKQEREEGVGMEQNTSTYSRDSTPATVQIQSGSFSTDLDAY